MNLAHAARFAHFRRIGAPCHREEGGCELRVPGTWHVRAQSSGHGGLVRYTPFLQEPRRVAPAGGAKARANACACACISTFCVMCCAVLCFCMFMCHAVVRAVPSKSTFAVLLDVQKNLVPTIQPLSTYEDTRLCYSATSKQHSHGG